MSEEETIHTATNDMTESRIATLARVDERTRAMQNDLSLFRRDLDTSLKNLTDKIKESENRAKEQFGGLEKDFKELTETLDKKYVKKSEFSPIQKIVYGILSTVGVTVLIAIVSLVIHGSSSISISLPTH